MEPFLVAGFVFAPGHFGLPQAGTGFCPCWPALTALLWTPGLCLGEWVRGAPSLQRQPQLKSPPAKSRQRQNWRHCASSSVRRKMLLTQRKSSPENLSVCSLETSLLSCMTAGRGRPPVTGGEPRGALAGTHPHHGPSQCPRKISLPLRPWELPGHPYRR